MSDFKSRHDLHCRSHNLKGDYKVGAINGGHFQTSKGASGVQFLDFNSQMIEVSQGRRKHDRQARNAPELGYHRLYKKGDLPHIWLTSTRFCAAFGNPHSARRREGSAARDRRSSKARCQGGESVDQALMPRRLADRRPRRRVPKPQCLVIRPRQDVLAVRRIDRAVDRGYGGSRLRLADALRKAACQDQRVAYRQR